MIKVTLNSGGTYDVDGDSHEIVTAEDTPALVQIKKGDKVVAFFRLDAIIAVAEAE